ncbi:MAG: thioredoxin domain-containing protein, partial [Terracidiphilus sp.]
RLMRLMPLAVAFAVLFFVGLGIIVPSRARATGPAAKPAKAVENLSAPVKTYGSKNAPIELEVFGDYECPSCGAFYESTLRPMINDYVAAGKVYIVHRDFPLPMHKYGYEAARWANAAASIGKFPEAEAALYDNQNYWAESGNIEKYLATTLSPIDMRRIQKLMGGCEMAITPGSHTCPFDAYIEQDKALGNQIPVQATPTFLIYHKGQKFPAGQGVVSYTVLKQFFDQLLSQ